MGAILNKRKDKREGVRDRHRRGVGGAGVYKVRRAEPSGLLHLSFNTQLITVALVHTKKYMHTKKRKQPQSKGPKQSSS